MPEDIEWHFIGPLQSNKAAMLVKNVPSLACVETVSTTKLATKLNNAVPDDNKKLGIYIQVNTSGEASKSGVSTKEEASDLVKYISTNCPKLELQGLMTIGAPGDDSCFDTLMDYRTHLGNPSLELSMGMSGDYEQAIAKGSTSVRVGSTIFGQRNYNK